MVMSDIQLYSGGPLNKAAGDYLTSQGVTVFILYGASVPFHLLAFFLHSLIWQYRSEAGIMSTVLPGQHIYSKSPSECEGTLSVLYM
jgi:hypothetical protein